MSGRFNILLIVLACIFSIILATIFIGNALSKTGGEITLPLDDPYIFFVYARNAAHGHLFHYNVEDPPSLGLTSLSYYSLCTIGYVTGFQGKNIVWFSHIIALAAFAGSLIIAANFFNRRGITIPFLAAVLTFSMGKILWGFYCGMEVPILSFLLFAACCAFVDGRTRLFFILLTLASLTRPEICLLLFGASLIYGLTALKSKKYIHAVYFLIPLIICSLIYGSVFLITGSFFNTAIQKSPFFTGDFSLGRLVIRMNENYSTLLTYIWGYGTGFIVLTTILVLGLLRVKDREWIFPAVFFFGFFVEGIVAFGMWHHQRYFIPYLPEGMVILIIGWERLLKESPKILQLARICLILLFGWNILYWADLYGDNCRDMKWLNGKSLQFVNNYLDDSAILLVSDAGLIKYYSDRYVLDFFGLGARRLTAPNTRGGSGCVFEEMRRILSEKAGKNKKARQVYGFAYWRFGADALEKMAYWKPGDFLKSASNGDMVLMALHDNGLGLLDEEMIRCLKNLKLDWREMADVPRPDTSVTGYALVGDYNATNKIIDHEKQLDLMLPEQFTKGKFIRLSVRRTSYSWQPYIEGKNDLLVRPDRPFLFAIWNPETGCLKSVLSYQPAAEAYGISELPLSWIPYQGFFGYRHQMGEDKVFGYAINPAVYNGSQNSERPGGISQIPPDDDYTTQSLNIADLRSEADYGFTCHSKSIEMESSSLIEQRQEPNGTYLLEGGRSITGECSFRVRAQANRPLHILGRFGNVEPIRIQMVVNGYEVEKPWFLSSGPPNKWQYESFTIPADYITGNDRITLSVLQMEYSHLNLFHLWFYQPRQTKM